MNLEVKTLVETAEEMAVKETIENICINILKDADGETIEAVVRGVHMHQQLLKQLLNSMSIEEINYVASEVGYKVVKDKC